MAPEVKPISLFALRHPLFVALILGAAITGWGLVLHFPRSAAVAIGVVVAVLNFALWLPKYGPARRYTERLLAAEREETGT